VRRLTVQLGRVDAGQAYSEVINGNRSSAQSLLQIAQEMWARAAKLNSGQALNLLGSYYAGTFEIGDAKPDPFVPDNTPNLDRAWPYYEQAARLKNPSGLVNAGLVLTGVDTRVWNILGRDEKKGREYLEEAVRLEVPMAYYGLGAAMIQGIGTFQKNPKTEEEGVRLLGIAYCRGVPAAIALFNKSHKYKKPAQCPG
jgi:TPR repeat protein